MAKKTEQKSQSNLKREKLDSRISELESRAMSLEERAEYAEKEAKLRDRIKKAEDRIKATQPPGMFDGFLDNVSPSIRGMWSKTPTFAKAVLVLVVLIVVLLLIGKSCTGTT